ncbi:hypothetical protein CN395_27175, partial [Priestia megaterium]
NVLFLKNLSYFSTEKFTTSLKNPFFVKKTDFNHYLFCVYVSDTYMHQLVLITFFMLTRKK